MNDKIIGSPELDSIKRLDNFGFPELVPIKQWLNVSEHTLYCFFKTKMPREEKCAHCGSPLYKFGKRTHSYRDLPRLQERTVLVIKMQRFRCSNDNCEGKIQRKKSFVQRIAGIDSQRSMTTRCLDWIRSNCFNFTFQQIADQIGCDIRTVRNITYERINELNQEYKPYIPLWLGIDETCLDGNIDESCCVLVDLDQRKPIDMLENRLKETLTSWLEAFRGSPQLRGVAMDQCDYYRSAVKKVFPNVEIVLDRFHIERWANRAVDRVRIDTGKWLKKNSPEELNPEEWKQNSRLLRKHRHDIPDEDDPQKKGKNTILIKKLKMRKYNEQYDFFKWLAGQPGIATAYYLKEDFCGIYRLKRRYAAQKALEKWRKSVQERMLSPFKTVLGATVEWQEKENGKKEEGWKKEFLAYFPSGMTNGYTEALNSVVKRINRSGNGYSFEVLRARLLFGRKPKLKTVRLKPPAQKAFFRDSQPPVEICVECRRALDDSSTPVSFDDFLHPDSGDDNLSLKCVIACSMCHRPIDEEHPIGREAIWIADEASDELAKDVEEEFLQNFEVGDYDSAIRLLGNMCEVCNRLFNGDQLHSFPPVVLVAGDPPIQFVCTGCLEQLLGHPIKGSGSPISSTGSDADSGTDKAVPTPGFGRSVPTAIVIDDCPESRTGSTPVIDRRPPQTEAVHARITKGTRKHPLVARDLRRGFPVLPENPPEQLSFAFTA